MVTHKLGCDQAVFFEGGGGEGMPNTFPSRLVCCPLIKASVNIVFQVVCDEGG